VWVNRTPLIGPTRPSRSLLFPLRQQTIAAIEAGKYSPSLEAAFRIAEVFGKKLDEVFKWRR